MKNQLAVTLGFLLISTFSFAQTSAPKSQHADIKNQVQELKSQLNEFPLASRVACDEIIVSAAQNKLKIEKPEINIYASNQKDFVNFGCGTASEYTTLVEINMKQSHALSESDDFSSTTADRESRTQMIEAAREEFTARNTKTSGAR